MDIPFFNNSKNAFLKAVLGGFQLNGIYQIQYGQAITILAGRDANRNGDDGAGTAARNSFRTRGFSNTDLVILKNTRFGRDGRFNFQIGAEIFDLFNQRAKTINGVGAFTSAFNTAGNPNFNNYELGSFSGRAITMRAKFYF